MKLIVLIIIFLSLIQFTCQFAFRNEFEDDGLIAVERFIRDTEAITSESTVIDSSAQVIEGSGQENSDKNLKKRENEIEGSGEEQQTESRFKRSADIEGSGEESEELQRQRRADPTVSTSETVEGSGQE